MSRQLRNRLRLFVAIDLNDAVRQAIDGFVSPLKGGLEAKWVPSQNMHLTLKFFGLVEKNRIEALQSALKAAASQSTPFSLSPRGLGAFDSWTRARVLWLGVDSEGGELHALANLIEHESVEQGFKREERDYNPHLTLARAKGRSYRSTMQLDRAALEKTAAAVDFERIDVRALTLFKSTLTPDGPRYEIEETFELGPATPS